MHRTYAVTWQEHESLRLSGKLELRAGGLSLEGSNNGSGVVGILVPYEDLVALRFAPGRERLDGRPTLVLDRRETGSLRVASVAAPGIISEVAEQLAALKLGRVRSNERLAIVVPIRKGKAEEARRLLDQGPPFDPKAVGLGRHEVFLTDQEAVFFFESATGFGLSRLLGDRSVWACAAAWRDVIGGAPRVARPFYAWAAVSPHDATLVFGRDPGPGDSDGGDVYPP